MFDGYRFAPGGKWSGEYRVLDSDNFAVTDLAQDACGHGEPFHPHITRIIVLPKAGMSVEVARC